MANLIGLAGPAGSGKDTVATHLARYYGFRSLAFADPIRDMIYALLGRDRYQELLHNKEAGLPELCGASYRHLMQTLGTEWGRQQVHPHLWIRLAEGRIDARHRHVISDVRFENEAAWVRDRGGVIVHIRRSSAPLVRDHVSESGVSQKPEDVVFSNEGDLAEFRSVVDNFCRNFGL